MTDKKQLSQGAIIGRALTKLQALNDAEQHELDHAPRSIRDRYEAKREALLGELDPAVRAAVVAANKAAAAARDEEEGPASE